MLRRLAPWMLLATVVGLIAAALTLSRRDFSGRTPPPPPESPRDLEAVSIVERLDAPVPLDVPFTDDTGRAVTLADYFGRGRPVILNLVYYRCPGICNELLNSLTATLKEMDWTAGREFEIVTASIDPSEDHDLAASKKATYIAEYGRPSAAGGWHFLTGKKESIEALAAAVGFGYRYEEGTGLFTHAAGLIMCTPDGRAARYLTDVLFEPATVELSLVEASSGKVGTPVQHLLLRFCYVYDATQGRYVVAARRVMTIGGALILTATLAGLCVLWRREVKLRSERSGRGSRDTTLAGLQP